MSARPARVAVVCDYPEERWPSMDLIGEMVTSHVTAGHAGEFAAERVCPPFRHRLSTWPVVGRKGAAKNLDRLLNRFRDYPRVLGRLAAGQTFDLFHVVDHSYSQLVHALPPGRAVVTCHDLDTFRCLFEPDLEPRPWWFRRMTARILAGLGKAAAVSCDSEATRDALLARRIVSADRAHVVYFGNSPEYSPDPDPAADAEAARLLGSPGPDAVDLLHVGSNIARKRVDVLLNVFAAVRRIKPRARLIKVGGAISGDLERRARELGVLGAIVSLPFLSRSVVAAVYRRASLVLQPSEAEGFGLPVIEALACGVPLLASDIAVLREVGGEAPIFRPVGDVPAWTEAALQLLDEPRESPGAHRARVASGLARARLYSWSNHADRLAAIYREVLSRSPR